MSEPDTDVLLIGLMVAVVGSVVTLVMVGKWWRRRLLLAALVASAVSRRFGFDAVASVGAGLVTALVGWRMVSPATFHRVVVRWFRRSRRRFWYRDRWVALMVGHGLGRQRKDETVVPRLHRRIVCGRWADRLWVRPLMGQSIDDWEKQTEALAMAIGSRGCRMAIERPGTVRVEVLWGDPLAAVVPALSVPATVDLAAVAVGIREDRTPWTVRLIGNHLLMAGVTGSGKSSVMWSTVCGIAPAVRAGTVQLWGIDPKGGMELAPGRALFARFGAGDLDEMAELLEAAVDAMRARAARYAGHHRTHQASHAEPLIVVVVDEMAFLTAYAGDHKLRDRINKALAVLLTQGRAVGVCVIAALQDPRKEVIGYRNLFPTKIALRLDERTQVDMVLGDGARAAGARCDQIPDSTPGVGYVKVDGIREPQRVRAGYVTDRDIAVLAARYPAPRLRDVA